MYVVLVLVTQGFGSTEGVVVSQGYGQGTELLPPWKEVITFNAPLTLEIIYTSQLTPEVDFEMQLTLEVDYEAKLTQSVTFKSKLT